MTPAREHALLLRLAAAILNQETRSIAVLREMLRELGYDDGTMDAAVARATAALLVQKKLFA